MNCSNRKLFLAACLLLALFSARSQPISKITNEFVFIAAKNSIEVCQLNPQTGAITNRETADDIERPQFLALDPARNFLFTLNTAILEGTRTGVVSAFLIQPTSGKLTFLNQQPTAGIGPTHLDLDRVGNNILVANYGSGSVAVFPIRKNGELKPATAFVQHIGSSINPDRQKGPHAHCINVDPANHFALSCDLGLDKVLVYKFDSKNGTLLANELPFASVKPGAGPRHLAFGAKGDFVYVINEMDSSVTAFSYDAKHGELKETQTISTLPKDFNGKNTCAEIAVHPSGRFLYGSNRGHDSIAIFAAEQKTGKLKAIGYEPSGGKSPRHFEIDPTGNFLFAENENSNNIVIFRIDLETGVLTPTGTELKAESPQCVKFLPAP